MSSCKFVFMSEYLSNKFRGVGCQYYVDTDCKCACFRSGILDGEDIEI